MNKFNIECYCKVSLENSDRFWRNVIEFNVEAKETKSFASETDMISQWSRKRRIISILISCRNIERKYEEFKKTDSKSEFQSVTISSSIRKKSNWFVKQTNVIFQNFQKSRMTHVLIWDCQYWKFCRKIDWFSNSIIETIFVTKKKCWFAMINRHVFELLFEQEKWLHYQILNDFQIEYWTIFWFDIEIIELRRKNDRFVKKINKISICSRRK